MLVQLSVTRVGMVELGVTGLRTLLVTGHVTPCAASTQSCSACTCFKYVM